MVFLSDWGGGGGQAVERCGGGRGSARAAQAEPGFPGLPWLLSLQAPLFMHKEPPRSLWSHGRGQRGQGRTTVAVCPRGISLALFVGFQLRHQAGEDPSRNCPAISVVHRFL